MTLQKRYVLFAFMVTLHWAENFICFVLNSVFKDSKLDITIGPYETYEDTIFGYKVFLMAIIYNALFVMKLPLLSFSYSVCLHNSVIWLSRHNFWIQAIPYGDHI